jgi:hypothetical protein
MPFKHIPVNAKAFPQKNHQKPTSSSLLKENRSLKILRSFANGDFLKDKIKYKEDSS